MVNNGNTRDTLAGEEENTCSFHPHILGSTVGCCTKFGGMTSVRCCFVLTMKYIIFFLLLYSSTTGSTIRVVNFNNNERKPIDETMYRYVDALEFSLARRHRTG